MALLLAITVLAFIGSLRAGFDARRARPQVEAEQHSLLPSNATLEVMSLGYRTLVADLIWVRALQYREKGVNRERKLVPIFADAIIHLDPDFAPAYRWAANTMVFSGGITEEGVSTSNKYLELAMRRFPDEAYYPYTLALNYAFYYPRLKLPENERRALRDKAIEYLHLAMQRKNHNSGIPLLISGLMDDEDEAKLAYVEQALLTETDIQVRRVLEGKLAQLSSAQRLRAFELKRRLRNQWLYSNYAYLPFGLAVVLGERLQDRP
ncbi:MAG: hypothetical protein RBU37_25140 [Myxococcota bacterium]|nr:hypothetical protein [Myxococcota bacterium]